MDIDPVCPLIFGWTIILNLVETEMRHSDTVDFSAFRLAEEKS